MADVDFEDFDDGYGTATGQAASRAARFSHLVNIAGAVSSVALVIGLGVWGYKLAVRDVTGIPVFRAAEGPMRIAPENPGGEVAAHQGLAVNDVAALGTAAPPPETLILAPRPVELTAEDAAAEDLNGAAPVDPLQDTALAPVLSPVIAPDLAAAAPSEQTVLEQTAPDQLAPIQSSPAQTALEQTGPDPDAVAKALAEALATDSDATMVDEAPLDGTVTEDMAALDPNPEASATIRPRARPATIGSAADAQGTQTDPQPDLAPALAEAPAQATTTEVDAAMIPAGTRLVQLGAFDTEDQARGEWVRLNNKFAPAFAGKAMVVQAAESGGRTFYRLRAHGFADETDARGFCLTLLEQNASCIPVEQR